MCIRDRVTTRTPVSGRRSESRPAHAHFMETVKKFIEIFQGLNRAHGVTKVSEINSNGNKIKGKSFIIREDITYDHWVDHISGKESLGVIPINDDNKCKWGCIDIDVYNVDHLVLMRNIKGLSLPLVTFRSKSGGAHLFLFAFD